MIFALKIIGAAVILVSVVLRTVMDFVWKDKRTSRHRKMRTAFIVAAIFGASLNAIVLAIEETKKSSDIMNEKAHREEFENLMMGGIAPEITVFLYKDFKMVSPPPDEKSCRTNWFYNEFTAGEPPKAGNLFGPEQRIVILVGNTNNFPLYDAEIQIETESPTSRLEQNIQNQFNRAFKPVPLFYPNTFKIFSYVVDSDLSAKLLEFRAKTRKGFSEHIISMVKIKNRWEYDLIEADSSHMNVTWGFRSQGFPKDLPGSPLYEVLNEKIKRQREHPYWGELNNGFEILPAKTTAPN